MPPLETTNTGDPEDWMRYARSDLVLARMTAPEGVLNETLCFHAQQAAEKAVKAVLLAEGIPVPHTHDINLLLKELPPHVDVPPPVRRATRLTEYAVASRYPADVVAASEEERREAVRLAEAVVAWAAAQVQA